MQGSQARQRDGHTMAVAEFYEHVNMVGVA